MINELIKLSTHLDSIGSHKEADYLDVVIRKKAQEYDSALHGPHTDNMIGGLEGCLGTSNSWTQETSDYINRSRRMTLKDGSETEEYRFVEGRYGATKRKTIPNGRIYYKVLITSHAEYYDVA